MVGEGEFWSGRAVRDGVGGFFEDMPEPEVWDELEGEAFENGETGWSSFVHRIGHRGKSDTYIARTVLIFVCMPPSPCAECPSEKSHQAATYRRRRSVSRLVRRHPANQQIQEGRWIRPPVKSLLGYRYQFPPAKADPSRLLPHRQSPSPHPHHGSRSMCKWSPLPVKPRYCQHHSSSVH